MVSVERRVSFSISLSGKSVNNNNRNIDKLTTTTTINNNNDNNIPRKEEEDAAFMVWVYTICPCPFYRTLGVNGLIGKEMFGVLSVMYRHHTAIQVIIPEQ